VGSFFGFSSVLTRWTVLNLAVRVVHRRPGPVLDTEPPPFIQSHFFSCEISGQRAMSSENISFLAALFRIVDVVLFPLHWGPVLRLPFFGSLGPFFVSLDLDCLIDLVDPPPCKA